MKKIGHCPLEFITLGQGTIIVSFNLHLDAPLTVFKSPNDYLCGKPKIFINIYLSGTIFVEALFYFFFISH